MRLFFLRLESQSLDLLSGCKMREYGAGRVVGSHYSVGKDPAFKVGGRIEAPYFVDREEELVRLSYDVRTLSQSNVIIAPRRFGKTALLRAVESQVGGELLVSYLSCLGMVSPAEFHDRIVEGVLRAFAARHGRGRRLLATWRDLLKKPVLGMRDALAEIGGSIEGVGTIRLKFRTREVDPQGLMEAALTFPEGLAEEEDERVLVILDEFQALVGLGERVFSLFKEAMESQKRVVYLFSGSSLRLLNEVFGREGKSPLYQMVGRVFLGEIEPRFVHRFYRERLGLEREIAIKGRRRVAAPDVDRAFAQLLDELAGDFQERWETRFSDQQRSILKVLAEGPMSVTEAARSLGVAPPNISYSLSRLTEAMILTKEERRYRITDRVVPFLRGPAKRRTHFSLPLCASAGRSRRAYLRRIL